MSSYAAYKKLPREPGRDLVWDAMWTVAKRLSARATESAIEVQAVRRRSLRGWSVTEGLWFGNLWVEGFEPVRKRRLLGERWYEVQPVQDAAAKVGRFLRERPDLAAAERTRIKSDD